MQTTEAQRLAALQFELSRRIDATVTAQRSLNAEQRRQGLPAAQEFFSLEEVEAERLAARVEMIAMARDVIADTRAKFDSNYRPDALHRALIDLASSFRAAGDNVIPLARAIEAAARKRRGET